MGILEPARDIVLAVKEIASFFSIKKIILWVFLILIFIAAVLFIFENITGQLYFSRLNKKIDVLRKINDQLPKKSSLRQEILKEYNSIIEEVSKYEVSKKIPLGNRLKLSDINIQNIFKFLSAIILPLLFILFGSKTETPKGKRDIMIGAIIVALISGIIAVFIPIIYKPWVNFLGFPFLQLTILMIGGLMIKK